MQITVTLPTWKTFVAVALGVGVIATVVVTQAQQKGGRVTPLTALDYAEIQQLYSRYAFAYDTAAENGDAYAKLFTSDGAFTFPEGDPRCVPSCQGPEALAVLARGRGNKGPLTLSHYTTNVVIEASPEGAKGKAYLALPVGPSDGGRPALRAAGLYEDVIVKTPEGWRFKVRAYTWLPNLPAAPPAASRPSAPPPASR
jgi:hypothetical protein